MAKQVRWARAKLTSPSDVRQRNRGISPPGGEEHCKRLGNPDFITADELADIVLFCLNLPQHVCVRDIVVMPTTSDFT